MTYYVSRDGGAAGGNCPSSASPTGATSCTDSGLAAGTYHYTVTAVWRSWQATSGSTPVTLASGALDHFAHSGNDDAGGGRYRQPHRHGEGLRRQHGHAPTVETRR